MKVIGFANKFYTLWEVTTETRPLGNGHSYLITHFTYIKNISFDKNVAIAKYPDAKIDEDLRGKTKSFQTRKEVWDNVDTFRFGKYAYESIENGPASLDYIAWYWDQVYGDHKDYVAKVLTDNGYEIRKYYINGHEYEHLMSPEALKNEKIMNAKIAEVTNKINNGDDIILHIDSNPNEYGEIYIDDIKYTFDEVKENYYDGYYYYLPALNGKGKRVKNKDIKVKIEIVDNKFIIKSFEVLKMTA